MAISQTLTEDVGPLPTWAWAVLGTLILAGVLIVRKKKSMNAAAAQQTGQASVSSNLGSTPISNLSVTAEPMPIQMGDTFVNVPYPSITQTQTQTNAAAPSQSAPPTGTPMPPPSPAPAPNNPVQTPNPPANNLTPAAPPAPAPAPTGQKTVTVCPWPQWCGSLWGIAQKEYGNGNLWPRIYQANKGLIGANPNLIHPGQVLVIP